MIFVYYIFLIKLIGFFGSRFFIIVFTSTKKSEQNQVDLNKHIFIKFL